MRPRPVFENLPEPPFDAPCVVFKPLTTFGGLEIYALELAHLLDAPLYTARESIEVAIDSINPEIREFGQNGWFDQLLRHLPVGSLAETIRYEAFSVPDQFDAVITIGEVAKSVIHKPHQRRYHVLNMPPRWLFDQGPGRYRIETARGWIRALYQSSMRTRDISTLARLNDIVATSDTIATRLETYYHRGPSGIIYPPIRTNQYYHRDGDGYFLYLGRLSQNKRISELVDAVSGSGQRVKIAGTGPLADELEEQAGQDIDFLGFVSEDRKRELLARCDAVLFNSDSEAFGMVPVEAFASGKPVIGVRDGFTKHQISPGTNGILFEREIGGIRDAIERFNEMDWDPEVIQGTAKEYDINRFRTAWRSLLQDGRVSDHP